MRIPPSVFALVLGLVACGGEPAPSSSDLRASADILGPDARDFGPPATASAVVGCGDLGCAGSNNVCCGSDPSSAGSCVAATDACGARRFFCDDSADCSAGEVCCLTSGDPSVGSRCLTAADCDQRVGLVACREEADCVGRGLCCHIGPSHCCVE
jgi:hypothetical protein